MKISIDTQWQTHPFHGLLVSSVLTFWFIVLSFIMIKRLCIDVEKDKQISTMIRNLAIVTSVLLFLFSTTTVIGSMWLSGLFEFDETIFFIVYIFGVLLFLSALIALALCIILRLTFSFKGSQFEISTTTLYGYFIMLAITAITGLFGCVGFWFRSRMTFNSAMMGLSIAFCFGVGIAIHVCYTFNRNLFTLVLQQRQSLFSRSGIDSNDERQSCLNETQLIMIRLITKYTLIHSVGVLSFLFVTLSSGVGTLIELEIGRITFMWTSGFAVIVSTYSILLSFQSMDSWYYASYGQCHVLLNRCCMSLAERKMNALSTGHRSTTRAESDSEI